MLYKEQVFKLHGAMRIVNSSRKCRINHGRLRLLIYAPIKLVGVARIVLLPEGLSAVHAARKSMFQNNLNLVLGSALASIGLTIPAV